MKITPQDIHHKEFKRALRGYSEEEVDLFLDQLADQFENVYKQNHTFEEELNQLKDKLKTYQNMELTLQNTLLTAQKSAEEVQMSAKKEADTVLNNAKTEAKNTLSKIEKQKQVLNESLAKIKSLESDLKSKIRSSLDSFVQRINKIDADEGQLLEEIEKEFAAMPEVEIPKVEKITKNIENELAKKPVEKEKVKVAAGPVVSSKADEGSDGKADASKSDIASEAEIDKFLQQEQPIVEETSEVSEESDEKKASFLGRIFKRTDEPGDNGNENNGNKTVKVKAPKTKKTKAKKDKKSKKKNTEEIEV